MGRVSSVPCGGVCGPSYTVYLHTPQSLTVGVAGAEAMAGVIPIGVAEQQLLGGVYHHRG
jgi:hypothetical protein